MTIENGLEQAITQRISRRPAFTIRKGLFWLLSPALVALLVAPLFVGHVVVRLLIAGMRRRTHDRQGSMLNRSVTAPPAWRSPMLRGVSIR